MADVADTQATGITGFLQRLYKPIYTWSIGVFATKTELNSSLPEKATEASVRAIVTQYGDE